MRGVRLVTWLRPFAQPATYLGVAMIVIIWGGAIFLAKDKHDNTYENALRQGNNLTRIIGEYIAGVIKGTDSQLLMLRSIYQQNNHDPNLKTYINDAISKNKLAVNIALFGVDGAVMFSSLDAPRSGINIRDREHFIAHVNAQTDELVIGKPVIGRVSGNPAINLTRRLTAADGSFGGVIGASLDTARLEKFFDSIDVGKGGVLSLLGLDGVIRARSSHNSAHVKLTGHSIPNAKVFELIGHSSTGSYWTTPQFAKQLDGILRLVFYRKIGDAPLIAIVGLAEQDIFAKSSAEAYQYYQLSAALTAFVLVFIGIAAVRRASLLSTTKALESSKLSLEQANIWFHAAIENMAHGLSMFDSDWRLLVCNKRYADMYGHTAEEVKPGTTIRALLESRAQRKVYPDKAGNIVELRMSVIQKSEAYQAVLELTDGRIYEINHQPMPNGGWVAIHQDVTERRRFEQELSETKRFLHTIIEQVPISIVVKDPATQKIILVNKTYEEFTGMPRERLIGSTVFDIYQPKHAEMISRAEAELLHSNKRIMSGDLNVELPTKGSRIITATRLVVCDSNNNPQYLISVIEDSTSRKKSESQISFMAHHDLLTGLVNRAMFLKKIEESGARLRRRGEAFTVFMLDLDRFKGVNDSLGHHTGDELLKQAAQRLRANLRDTDTLARLGGDEFAIIQTTNIDQRENAISLAIRLIDSLNEPFEIEGHKLNIGTSIGIALAPDDGTEADELIKKADMALYRAKAEGRNSYSFFDPAMTAQADARHHLENDLRRAISNKELELHYQPIIDVKSQTLNGVEALVRWRHPQKGLISPQEFIPLAEETGLIVPLGEYVLQQACTDAINWPNHVKVSINLSPVQFKKGNLLDVILCLLVETGLPPQRLELEITESVLFEDEGRYVSMLHQLKNLGISIALDDFGTGYSSLSYLTMFPFDKIKIDKSFTLNMTRNPTSAAIIAAVLSLGRSLDIATTAEGVETWQEFQSLRVSGVNFVQGFLFGRPARASEIDFHKKFSFDAMNAGSKRTVAHVA